MTLSQLYTLRSNNFNCSILQFKLSIIFDQGKLILVGCDATDRVNIAHNLNPFTII